MPDDSQLPDLTSIATPNELQFRRAYAKSLLEQGLGPITTPAVSPFQAIGGLMQAYQGRQMLNSAATADRARTAAGAIGEAGTGPAGGMLNTQPPSGAQGAQATGQTDPMGPLLNAVSREEGTGSYSQLGPVTKDGDRAYGKYQVMGKNVGPWSQEILGRPMSPDEFLRNPGAQEAVARAKLGQYAQQYGPEGAAKAWFAGPGGMNNPNATAHRPDGTPFGTTVGQYGANVAAMMGPQGAAPPGGATPQGGVQNASAVGPLAFRPPAPGGMPPPNTGLPGQVPPNGSIVPMRPGMTTKQFETVMATGSDADKAEARARYLEQNQPTQFGLPGGGSLVRTSDGRTMVLPGVQMTTQKTGPLERQLPMITTYGPNGMPQPQIIRPGTIGPQSSAAPPPGAAPTGGAQPAITAGKNPLDAVSPELSDEDKKTLGGGIPEAKSQKSSQVNIPQGLQLASAGMSDAPIPGIEKLTQPGATQTAPAIAPQGGPLSAKPPMPASLQTAQAGPGPAPDVSPEDNADLQYLQNLEVQKNYRETGNTQALESARKYYEGISTQAEAAAQQRDELAQLGTIVNSPDFYSGFGSGFVNAARNAGVSLGILDPRAAASTQAFEKMRNDINLQSLRSKLGGLGQIRLAEVNMVNNAFANRDNSVAANRALVFLAQQINDRTIKAGDLANDYVQEHGGVADQSLRNRIFNFYKSQPLMTDDQIKQFNDMIQTDRSQNKGGPLTAQPPGTQGPAPPAGFKKVQ